MIRVNGILSNPFGEAQSKAIIRFTPTINGVKTIACLGGKIITGLDGSYSFTLKPGKYLIETNATHREYADAVIINLTAEEGMITLEELIDTYAVCGLDMFPTACPVGDPIN